jgi:DnaJ-class molecular chaperone
MAEQDVLDKIDDVLGKIEDVLEKLTEVEVKMSLPKSLQRFCRHCGGTGNKVMGEETGSCPDCGGDGLKSIGRITLTSEE